MAYRSYTPYKTYGTHTTYRSFSACHPAQSACAKPAKGFGFIPKPVAA